MSPKNEELPTADLSGVILPNSTDLVKTEVQSSLQNPVVINAIAEARKKGLVI